MELSAPSLQVGVTSYVIRLNSFFVCFQCYCQRICKHGGGVGVGVGVKVKVEGGQGGLHDFQSFELC